MYELLGRAQRHLAEMGGGPPAERSPSAALCELGPSPAANFRPLRRVALTEGVVHTLFNEYRDHRQSERGDEETGWLLLGRREEDEAIVRATLPAGADREAGEAHVRFNSIAQAVASRIVRQVDRRLSLLGVVQTHPGSLRHPSDGDFRGDIRWVGQLRGGEGIFGIGTADADGGEELQQGDAGTQVWRDLCLSWYTLRAGSNDYQPMPLSMIDGPDLATGLRAAWPTIEGNADRFERLARQQAKLAFDVVEPNSVAIIAPLENGDVLRAIVTKESVRYFLDHEGQSAASDLHEPRVDCGIYRLLADISR